MPKTEGPMTKKKLYGENLKVWPAGLTTLLFCAQALAQCEHTPTEFNCTTPISAYDGDTFHIQIPDVHPFFKNIQVRLRGIDAPEMDSKDKCELEMAKKARDALQVLLNASCQVSVSKMEWDKYGGRIVASATAGKVNLADYMLSQGLSVPYDGQKKPVTNWCNPLPPWPPKPTPLPSSTPNP